MLRTARRFCWQHAGPHATKSQKAIQWGSLLESATLGSQPRTCVPSRQCSVATEASVKVKEANGVGFVTLNRPKALNALSLDMIRLMTPQLKQWKEEGKVKVVMVR